MRRSPHMYVDDGASQPAFQCHSLREQSVRPVDHIVYVRIWKSDAFILHILRDRSGWKRCPNTIVSRIMFRLYDDGGPVVSHVRAQTLVSRITDVRDVVGKNPNAFAFRLVPGGMGNGVHDMGWDVRNNRE